MKTINFITCFWQFSYGFMMLNSNCTRIWAWIPVSFKKACVSFPLWGENSLQVWYIGIYMYASTERIVFTQSFACLFHMFLSKTGPTSPYQLIRQICVISWLYCYLFLFFISFYHLFYSSQFLACKTLTSCALGFVAQELEIGRLFLV